MQATLHPCSAPTYLFLVAGFSGNSRTLEGQSSSEVLLRQTPSADTRVCKQKCNTCTFVRGQSVFCFFVSLLVLAFCTLELAVWSTLDCLCLPSAGISAFCCCWCCCLFVCFGQCLLLNLEFIELAGLAGKQAPVTLLFLLPGIRSEQPHTWLSLGKWGLNFGPHA